MPHSNAQFLYPSSWQLSDKCDCLVLGVWQVPAKSKSSKIQASIALPPSLVKRIAGLFATGDIGSHHAASALLHEPEGIGAQRLLLINLAKGEKAEYSARDYNRACRQAGVELAKLKLKKLVTTLHLVELEGFGRDWRIRQFARQLLYTRYRFTDYQSKERKNTSAVSVVFAPGSQSTSTTQRAAYRRAIAEAQAISLGESACRDLGNTPPNVCTPEYLARQARALAKKYSQLKVEILNEKAMQREGMEALLAVARGSHNKPRLILLHYRPRSSTIKKPIVLVGKGISFDTGGISLKPALAMDEMKFDMCGAASVFGTMVACAELKIPRPVIGVMVCAENMPDGNATRPGDVVKTRSGLSVEILNTDAEGRLVLCDALDYIGRYKPASVIDIATLTGACVVALGKIASGLMSNDDELSREIQSAADKSLDAVWSLPLWEEYSEQLNSPVADMANIGGRDAGTITAACFLWKFCEEYRWAHLDIAGTAWLSPPQRTATGRPVSLLCQYLLDAK